jgi:peptide methionine sulfoxide reductase MsrA
MSTDSATFAAATFVHDATQASAAMALRDGRHSGLERAILTEIVREGRSWAAEVDHRRYLEERDHAGRAGTVGAA